jgi:hypothetical protein
MDKNMDNKSTQMPPVEKPVVAEKKKKKKKKKKKLSYNDMMAQILKPKISNEERIQLKKNSMQENALGGGRFSKMERI